jgi:hypothetical protein
VPSRHALHPPPAVRPAAHLRLAQLRLRPCSRQALRSVWICAARWRHPSSHNRLLRATAIAAVRAPAPRKRDYVKAAALGCPCLCTRRRGSAAQLALPVKQGDDHRYEAGRCPGGGTAGSVQMFGPGRLRVAPRCGHNKDSRQPRDGVPHKPKTMHDAHGTSARPCSGGAGPNIAISKERARLIPT